MIVNIDDCCFCQIKWYLMRDVHFPVYTCPMNKGFAFVLVRVRKIPLLLDLR